MIPAESSRGAAMGAGLATWPGSPVTHVQARAGAAFRADGGGKAGAGPGLEVSPESHGEQCALAPKAPQ